ncbi:MAG: hypothetical protein WCH46_07090 [bacterium]
MRSLIILFLFVLFSLTSCGDGKKKLFMPDSVHWTDQDIPLEDLPQATLNTDSVATLDQMKELFLPGDSLIEGRPISYYLNRIDISQTARDFYLKRFIPSAEPNTQRETYSLFDSLLTKNDTTRPFYYFLFLRLQKLEDSIDPIGYMDGSASTYAMKYVDEFYRRLKLPMYRSSFPYWVRHIVNSMPNISADEYRKEIIRDQSKNARKLTPELRLQIESFADSVFSSIRH